jgi:hypothetical protein
MNRYELEFTPLGQVTPDTLIDRDKWLVKVRGVPTSIYTGTAILLYMGQNADGFDLKTTMIAPLPEFTFEFDCPDE